MTEENKEETKKEEKYIRWKIGSENNHWYICGKCDGYVPWYCFDSCPRCGAKFYRD